MRNRLAYAAAMLVVIPAGLASRAPTDALPAAVVEYAGDVLWAVVVFLGVAIVRPGWSTTAVAVTAIALSFTVEVTQFYHAPWIDALRGTWLGARVLGFGFLWSDLACYAAGVGLGVIAEVFRSRFTAARATIHSRHDGSPTD